MIQSRSETAAPSPVPTVQTQSPERQQSSPRVNVAAVAAHLEFLGEAPELSGKPLLIEFWATWCGPCRASIRHLNGLRKKFGSENLNVVGITDEARGTVERFRRDTPMDYSVALDPHRIVTSGFQVRAVPEAWLPDKDGDVVWSGHPMELDEQTIRRVLSASPTA
jgi:thiol-disulfide isomerase/thioredoxin